MISNTVLENFSGKNCLVTGGTGMIGRQVVQLLADAGANIKIASLDNIKVDVRAEHVYGDLSDFQFCKDICADMDFVFHIAGIKGSIQVTKAKPASFFVPLLQMNTNMLEAARLCKAQKVVYTSSIGAYPSAEVFHENDSNNNQPPMDEFPGWAKRMAEMQVQAYRIQYGLNNFSIVRPCNVYGPGDNFDPENAMVVPSLMFRIANGENPLVVWGDGTAIRDFAFSRDVAEGVILACWYGTEDLQFLNLGSGIEVTIRELVVTLADLLNIKYEFDASKPSGFRKRVMDISLSRKVINYNPTTSLLDGLKETWDWFLVHRDEYLKRQNYFHEQ